MAETKPASPPLAVGHVVAPGRAGPDPRARRRHAGGAGEAAAVRRPGWPRPAPPQPGPAIPAARDPDPAGPGQPGLGRRSPLRHPLARAPRRAAPARDDGRAARAGGPHHLPAARLRPAALAALPDRGARGPAARVREQDPPRTGRRSLGRGRRHDHPRPLEGRLGDQGGRRAVGAGPAESGDDARPRRVGADRAADPYRSQGDAHGRHDAPWHRAQCEADCRGVCRARGGGAEGPADDAERRDRPRPARRLRPHRAVAAEAGARLDRGHRERRDPGERRRRAAPVLHPPQREAARAHRRAGADERPARARAQRPGQPDRNADGAATDRRARPDGAARDGPRRPPSGSSRRSRRRPRRW